MTHPFGPPELGRGIVVGFGQESPAEFSEAPRYEVSESTLAAPAATLEQLYLHWLRRERVVVELAVDKHQLKEPERWDGRPYELDPDFEFSLERLHFLLWANNYDGTGDGIVWWHGLLAQRLGAAPHPEADLDLEGPYWVDGGPRSSLPFPLVHRESVQLGQLTVTLPSVPLPESLAPDQLKAVSHDGGGARILAPAGSGKTRVLTHRFRNLLARQIEPQLVTALAYNKRAAQEMQKRLQSGKQSVRTLHSLGYSILRETYPVRVASQTQVRNILRRLIRVAPQLNTDPYQPYLEAFQAVRLGLRSPQEVEEERDDIPGFADAFPKYRKLLADQDLVDHDEQIYGTIELLLQNPDVRKRAQRRCSHLLVDEFQDLTPAFLLLIRLLSAPSYQIFAVGDDDQVIYGYAGATPHFLVDFRDYFPYSKEYQLTTNYRCPKDIVSVALALLDHNQVRVDKDVSAINPIEAAVKLTQAEQNSWTEEAVTQIQSWLQDHDAQDIAVLSRVNALLLPLQVALGQETIPHTKVVNETILNRTGVRTALAYWRLCRAPDDMRAEDLADALRRPNRKLKREYLEAAGRCTDRKSLRAYSRKLGEWPKEQLEEFLTDLTFLGRRLKKGLPSFFRALRKETEFLGALEQLDSSGLGSSGSSHSDDLLALEQLSHLCSEEDFEEWLRLELRREPSEEEGVRLSSVHRVKGLEWPCVLIFGAENGLFPHRLADDEEEERRILHVALTRTQKECAIISSQKSPSPFLKEMGRSSATKRPRTR